MNLLIAIIDGIVGFIRRNPLFCLLIFLLALFAPSVLGGIAMFVLYALLGLVVLAIILLLSFRWRIYRMRKDLEDQFGGQGFGPGGSGGPAGNAREGEIHIRKTKGAGEKRVRKDVGDYEWKNRAGSALTADGREQINGEDMFLLGNVVPHSTGGMNNTFKFKNLTLSVYLDYALGHSIYNYQYTRCFQTSMGNCNWNLVNDVKQCWSQPGDKTKYARFTANDPDWGNRNFSRMSDVFVEKGDYLCIRDISLSYKLPVRWTSRLGMKDVTLTVSGNTLYYWTAVHGVSPEAATTGGLYNLSLIHI